MGGPLPTKSREGTSLRIVMLNLFQHPCRGRTEAEMVREPCVYILASGHYGTLYIGVTSDLTRRLHEHRSDAGGGFTGRYAVRRLVHVERFDDMEHAILREKQLKRWHRDWKIALIERENPHWADLAVALGFQPLTSCERRNGP